MMTWRLWQAFKHPPATHPVFQRITADRYEDRIELFTLLQRILTQGQIWFWLLLFMLNMRALIFMVFSGTLYGAIWSVRISGAIAAERQNGRYDLLCSSPAGTVGATWAICTGCLHQNQALEQITSQEAWSVRLILFIPIVISAPLIAHQIFSVTFSTTFVGIVAVMTVFYLDHIQSIVFGGLLGVLASHYAPNPLDQRLWALAGFFGLQIISYLIQIVVSFLILPALFRSISTGYAEVGIALVSVLTFYFVREIMVSQLWRIVVKQLSGSPAELDFLFDTSIERTAGSYADSQIMARTP